MKLLDSEKAGEALSKRREVRKGAGAAEREKIKAIQRRENHEKENAEFPYFFVKKGRKLRQD